MDEILHWRTALPQPVEVALLKAGWKPGERRRLGWFRRRERPRLESEFPLATAILDELYGLKVPALAKRGPFPGSGVEFLPDDAAREADAEDLQIIERPLRVRLCPIGWGDNRNMVLLIADTGHMLGVSFACGVIWLFGESFGEGLDRYQSGKSGLLLQLSPEQDPSGIFVVEDTCYVPSLCFSPSTEHGLKGSIPPFPEVTEVMKQRITEV